jgi:iduronate 2-sulfatase
MVTLPEYFKTHGYNTTGCGKTYHSGRPKNFDQPRSWTEGVLYHGYDQGLGFCGDHCACALGANDTQHFTDDGLAARAIEILESHRAHGIGPWFVAVGFIRSVGRSVGQSVGRSVGRTVRRSG